MLLLTAASTFGLQKDARVHLNVVTHAICATERTSWTSWILFSVLS